MNQFIYNPIVFMILLLFNSIDFSQLKIKQIRQNQLSLILECNNIDTLFFDLGETLVENNGNGLFQLKPGALEMIDTLRLEEITLGIITNVPKDWSIEDLMNILVDPSFLNKFEVIVLSSHSPAEKPDPAIYTYAYSLLSHPIAITHTAFITENIDHIANSETNPTLGARSVGMLGIHFSNLKPNPLTNYTIPHGDFQAIITIVDDLVFCNNFENT